MNCNLQTNSNRKFLGLKKDPVLSFMSTNLNFAVLYSTVFHLVCCTDNVESFKGC